MRSILLFCFVLCLGGQLFAQLTVADVRKSWETRQGTIEEATLSVRTKGVYMECGLYLTFSARGNTFSTPADSLEVTLKFSLPLGSSVTDCWLWVGDNISRAHIFDKYTAGAIYEGIVKRRKDPSILYKTNDTQYQLRVFPMNKVSTRRVKITWLQPVTIGEDKARLSLPINILGLSKYPIQKFNLSVWTDDRYKAPSILNQPNTKFEVVNDTAEFGQYYRTQLFLYQYEDIVQLAFASPLQNGYYLSTGESRGEQFYQLAVLPRTFIPTVRRKKVAFCMDYQLGNNSYLDILDAINASKSSMLNNLVEGDSFNLFYTKGLAVQQASNHWIPASKDSIEAAFQLLSQKLATYSNLQSLLAGSIEWMKTHGSEGYLILASNGAQYANLTVSNNLLNAFLAILPTGVSIHTIDYSYLYANYFYWDGYYYYGNSYLLSTLSSLSHGAYYRTIGTTSQKQVFTSTIESLFSNIGTTTSIFDFNTNVQNGFCYGTQDVSNGGSTSINLDQPVVQIGKYIGNSPFHFEMSTIYNNQPINTQVEIPESETNHSDTLVRQAWNGKYLQTLEKATQNISSINTILYTSLNSRVLSRYTAFLCLEDTSYYCKDCLDETQTTSTEDLVASDSLLTAYPNPFSSQVTIQINAEFSKQEHPSFEVYDLKGQLVHYFTLSTGVNEQKIEWDGSSMSGDQIPAGVYIGLMKLKDRTVVLKLVKV